MAQLLIEQGNGSKAIDLARRAAKEFEQTKAAEYESVSYAVLAQASLSERRIAEAREAIDQALAPSGRYHDREAELFVGVTAARVRAASANPVDRAQAEQNLRNALAEATTAGFVDYGLQARLILGEIQMSSGRKAEGRACLTALEREAVHKGFNLIAQQATAALRTEWSTEK